MTAVRLSVVLACAAAMLSFAPSALAAPPPNDARAGAQALGRLPASVRGTTVEATLEASELGSACTPPRTPSGSRSPRRRTGRSMIVALDAEGDLDATIDVYARERSQVSRSPARTRTAAAPRRSRSTPQRGTSYYVRVGARRTRPTIASGLRVVVAATQPATLPGSPAAAQGRRRRGRPVRESGRRVGRPPAARPDVPAELRLVRWPVRRQPSSSTARTRRERPVRRLRCDAHTVFAPSASGTYSVLVRAPRASRERLNYRAPRRPRAARTTPRRASVSRNDVRDRGHLQRQRARRSRPVPVHRSRSPSLLRLTPRHRASDFDLRL